MGRPSRSSRPSDVIGTDDRGRSDSSDLPLRLREVLQTADFTYDAVAGLLGTRAHEALGRNETTPALRRTVHERGAASPLATLTRLFLLQAPVALADAEHALPDVLGDLEADGFLERSAGEVRALLDIRPYATDGTHFWVASDLTPGLDGAPVRVDADHVLGISPAAVSLAQLTLREPVGSALDLGTGCGVQALHLAAHAGLVVATDVNERALRLTRFNALLNELATIDVREGSLLEPVARRELRPDRHQPAVRHLAGDGRPPGLPGLRPARRLRRRADRA